MLLSAEQQLQSGGLVDELERINDYCELYRRRVGRLRLSEAEKPSTLEVATDLESVEGVVVGETAPLIDVIPGRVLLVDDNALNARSHRAGYWRLAGILLCKLPVAAKRWLS